MNATLDFLHAFYPEPFAELGGPGRDLERPPWLVIWSRVPRTTTSTSDWTDSVEAAAATAEHRRAGRDVHFGVALQDRTAALAAARCRSGRMPAPSRVRGRAATTAVLPALWMDLDVCGPGHRSPTLPPTGADALRLLDAVPHRPSCLVRSGSGYHAYWLLRELWILDSDAERAAAKALLRRLQWAIRRRAEERGWSTDFTAELSRVMRLPGTFNHKTPTPRPVEIEVLDPERRYTASHFELLPAPPEPKRRAAGNNRRHARHRTPSHAARLGAGSGDWDPADFRRVFAGCSWLRWCHSDRRRLPEDHWYAALSIVGRCEIPAGAADAADGRQLAHRMSRGYPGYHPAETDAKLDHALDSAGPRTCEHIAKERGAEKAHCRRCPYFGIIPSPIVLGNPPHFEDPAEANPPSAASAYGPPFIKGGSSSRASDEDKHEPTNRGVC